MPWPCSVNLIAFIWILVEDALRAGPDGNPPSNMTQALIFNGSTIAATALVFVIGFRGQQKRREKDIANLREAVEEEPHVDSHKAQPFPSEKE
jgi:MFS transporter, FLVCR family, MFS-domain-containing protein 7